MSVTNFFFNMDLSETLIFICGVIIASLVELGTIFGHLYPCVGQISRGLEAIYYIAYFLKSLLVYYDRTVYTAITIYLYQFTNVLAVNYCARGLLYTPDFYEFNSRIDANYHAVDAALEAITVGVSIWEL